MSNIGSIDRAVAILDLYSQGEYELSPNDVAKKLDMSTSTAFRTMTALCNTRLLVPSNSKGKYRLSSKILELSRAYMRDLSLNDVASPHMRGLNEVTRESIGLDVIDGNKRICTAIVDSLNSIRKVLKIGDQVSIHAGAPSKILLAFIPTEKAKKILLSTGLNKLTGNTRTSVDEILEELDSVRRNGYSITKGEYDEHAYSIAAPVRNRKGEVVAALSIAGVTILLNQELEDKYAVLVQQYASAISYELGYSGNK